MYDFPKKVTYLGDQVGNHMCESGVVTTKQKLVALANPMGRNVGICIGSILFSLDGWILCSDNQNLQSACLMDK